MNFFKKKKNDSINKRNAFIQNSMITKNKNDNIKNDDIFKDKNVGLLQHEERSLEKDGTIYNRKELEESVNSFLDNSYKENIRPYVEDKIQINKSNTDKTLKIDTNNNNNNNNNSNNSHSNSNSNNYGNIPKEIKQYMDNSYASDYGMENYHEHMENQDISKNINDSSITHSKETTTILLNNEIENSIKKKESNHNHTTRHNNNNNNTSYITNNDDIIFNTQNQSKLKKNAVDNSLQYSDKINIVKDNQKDNISNDIHNYYNSKTSIKKNENKYNQNNFMEKNYNSIKGHDMSTLKFSTKYSHKDIHIKSKNDIKSNKDNNLSDMKDVYDNEKDEDVKKVNHLNDSIEFKKNNRRINTTQILNSSNKYQTEANENHISHNNNIGELMNSRNSNTNYVTSLNNMNDTNITKQIDNISISNNLNTHHFNDSKRSITYSNININEKSNFYEDSKKKKNIYSEYHNALNVSNKSIHINNNTSLIRSKNELMQGKNIKNSGSQNLELEETNEFKTNHLDDLTKNEANQNETIKNQKTFTNKRNSMIDSKKKYMNNISQDMYQSNHSNKSDWSIKKSNNNNNNQNILYRNDQNVNRTSINNIIINDDTLNVHNLENTNDMILENVDRYKKQHQNDITNSNRKCSLQNVLDNSTSYYNDDDNDDSKNKNFHLSNNSSHQKKKDSHEIKQNNNFLNSNKNLMNSTNSDIELLLNELSESTNSLLSSQKNTQVGNSKHFLTSQNGDNAKLSYLLQSNENINEELNNDIKEHTKEIEEKNNDMSYKTHNEDSQPFHNYKTKNMEHIKYDYIIGENNHYLNKSENLPRTKGKIDLNYVKYNTCVYKDDENIKRQEQRKEEHIESRHANLLYEFERGITKNKKKDELYKYDMIENLSNKNMKYVNDIHKENNINHNMNHNNDVTNNYYFKDKEGNDILLKNNNSSGPLSNISHFTEENNFTYHKNETQNNHNKNNISNINNINNISNIIHISNDDNFHYYTNNEEHNNHSLDFSIHCEDNMNISNNNNNSQQILQEYNLKNSGNLNVSSINKSKGKLDKNVNYMNKLTMNNNYVNTDLQISYIENELQQKIKDFDKSLGTKFEDKCNLILNRIEKLLSYEWFNDGQ
ncbi:hypothetical protein CYL21_4698 [Plasmodium falciparum NF54]|uniref:Uncharacterized protein n=2 Tax=Plasmodium falciparum TaxID=5833 RepID=Q8I5Q0_PLAF7|nr:conserved Plasmodium protein, unknown function [Plasmodium falciparum 3D7]EWC87570.1 hypothetical protein PFNF54_03694 [Plasmodium falciparum NF54]KAF4327216.1 hypothetical protein CYL21_4698 [Plasmodium falciparum NF54]PKC48350.1 hypothetical protein CK202_1763 [Plasmodium falciparum NF54]CZT99318.1 conserved Plasmodium protein, unknown function [Plasmodium falciparum 3D7]|eukprot:XP_001350560.1 conserved Plasmodium protein, unknown function [Plasmodium falciparum 3D7]